MKNQRGITIVALVITVIILMIIAGTAAYSGMGSIENANRSAFISELKMVQAEVNIISEKIKNGNTDYLNVGQSVNSLDSTLKNKLLSTCLNNYSSSELVDYKYFDESALEQVIGNGVSKKMIINFKTREVISVDGFAFKGKTYYKLTDFPAEVYNVGK